MVAPSFELYRSLDSLLKFNTGDEVAFSDRYVRPSEMHNETGEVPDQLIVALSTQGRHPADNETLFLTAQQWLCFVVLALSITLLTPPSLLASGGIVVVVSLFAFCGMCVGTA